MNILVTGAAGFIGYHLSQRLLADGEQVFGVDNLSSYYDVALKKARLGQLESQVGFSFQYLDIGDRAEMQMLFQSQTFDAVVHLAAQAGVRHSLENPWVYIDSNITGLVNLLECCRHQPIQHLVFASSSSVYGANTKIPFSVSDNVDYPVSLYAASKRANELLAHNYSHLYGIPVTGLRFFTVYGPWGRPDMAYFKFVQAIEQGKPIDVYNFGKMQRDFTYIDDIVEGIVRVLKHPPKQRLADLDVPFPPNSNALYQLYNIGNNKPVELLTFIEHIENALGKKAEKRLLPMQPGEVTITYADVDDLIRDVGFSPATPIAVGIDRFVKWYRDYSLKSPFLRD